MLVGKGLTAIACSAAMALGGCATVKDAMIREQPPTLAAPTRSLDALYDLAAPQERLYVAVYAFNDQTGQYKPAEDTPDYSRAVTQGAASILVNSLKDAGRGSWFTVLERENLNSLLQERQLIRTNREQFLGENGQTLPAIRGLYNAGILFGGGVVGFDSNISTGGVGARYLGIGSHTQYRRDQVTVYLRATSVTTGEVLVSVSVTKTIYSIALSADTFRFVSLDKLLELEGGVTRNEPGAVAVKQAVEKAVQSLVLEGADRGYWRFGDPEAHARAVEDYRRQKADLGYAAEPAPTPAPARAAHNRMRTRVQRDRSPG